MELPPKVSHIVTRFGRLKQLKDETDRLREFDARLKFHVHEPLSGHMKLATIRDGCLVIQADSPTWAARLRFKTPEILASLADDGEFPPIRSIRIRSMTEEEPPPPAAKRPSISPDSARALAAQAAFIEDDEVRGALLRLVGRVRE